MSSQCSIEIEMCVLLLLELVNCSKQKINLWPCFFFVLLQLQAYLMLSFRRRNGNQKTRCQRKKKTIASVVYSFVQQSMCKSLLVEKASGTNYIILQLFKHHHRRVLQTGEVKMLISGLCNMCIMSVQFKIRIVFSCNKKKPYNCYK